MCGCAAIPSFLPFVNPFQFAIKARSVPSEFFSPPTNYGSTPAFVVFGRQTQGMADVSIKKLHATTIIPLWKKYVNEHEYV